MPDSPASSPNAAAVAAGRLAISLRRTDALAMGEALGRALRMAEGRASHLPKVGVDLMALQAMRAALAWVCGREPETRDALAWAARDARAVAVAVDLEAGMSLRAAATHWRAAEAPAWGGLSALARVPGLFRPAKAKRRGKTQRRKAA
jgi:hypothetical protein